MGTPPTVSLSTQVDERVDVHFAGSARTADVMIALLDYWWPWIECGV